ncbi:MAG: outer membrane lipoprotein-sorting protein, partial [Acidobacteriota bacterium]
MKKSSLPGVCGSLAILLGLFGVFGAPGALGGQDSEASPSGDDVMARVNGRDRGGTARFELRLLLFDPERGDFSKRIQAEQRASDGGYRTAYRVEEPEHEHGIVLLVAEDETLDGFWMYFPRSDHLLPVATRSLSALGSDFICEDLRNVWPAADYEFEALGRTEVDGVECLEVQMTPASYQLRRELGFDRAVGCVREDNWVIIRSRYYDDEGNHFKTYRAKRVERVQGVWTVLESEMVNHRNDHRSTVEMLSVDYDHAASETALAPDALG